MKSGCVLDVAFLAGCTAYLWLRKATGSTASQQWTATPSFVDWLHKLIQRTGVSETIQMLALNLVMRLTKKTNIQGLPGSEYRILLVCLAVSNKLLEDNTFTARTWSDVSGLDVEAINVAEREVLKALGWRVLPTSSEWLEWRTQVAGYRQKRQEALHVTLPPSPVIFDPHYSLLGSPYLSPSARSRSQPVSPLRATVEEPSLLRRKRTADEADLAHPLLEQPPMNVARRSSAGALQRQPPLYQAALQQGYLRSASLSPISAFSPFASPVSTPYSTPPAVFSPVTYSYLTTRLPSPAMPVPPAVLWTTVLITDTVTNRITTQLVAAPMHQVQTVWPPTPRSSLGGGGSPSNDFQYSV